jgi:hypothetical protein
MTLRSRKNTGFDESMIVERVQSSTASVTSETSNDCQS